MASSKARNEAPTNPPAMEPSQDQRLNEKSSTQVQEMSPPHPVVNIPKASGDAAMHLEIQIETKEGSNGFRLPALINKTNNNDEAPRGNFMRTEIPDSDDYSEYSPDDENGMPLGAGPTTEALKKDSGSNGTMTEVVNPVEINLEQQSKVDVSKSSTRGDSFPNRVNFISLDSTGTSQAPGAAQADSVTGEKHIDDPTYLNLPIKPVRGTDRSQQPANDSSNLVNIDLNLQKDRSFSSKPADDNSTCTIGTVSKDLTKAVGEIADCGHNDTIDTIANGGKLKLDQASEDLLNSVPEEPIVMKKSGSVTSAIAPHQLVSRSSPSVLSSGTVQDVKELCLDARTSQDKIQTSSQNPDPNNDAGTCGDTDTKIDISEFRTAAAKQVGICQLGRSITLDKDVLIVAPELAKGMETNNRLVELIEQPTERRITFLEKEDSTCNGVVLKELEISGSSAAPPIPDNEAEDSSTTQSVSPNELISRQNFDASSTQNEIDAARVSKSTILSPLLSSTIKEEPRSGRISKLQSISKGETLTNPKLRNSTISPLVYGIDQTNDDNPHDVPAVIKAILEGNTIIGFQAKFEEASETIGETSQDSVDTVMTGTENAHMIHANPEQNEQLAAKRAARNSFNAPEGSKSKDVLMAELKAMKIASITARNAAIEAEIADKHAKLEEVSKDLQHPAAETVKNHIKLLHDYNDIRDVGQGLVGMIADNRGVRIGELYDEFGVGLKD